MVTTLLFILASCDQSGTPPVASPSIHRIGFLAGGMKQPWHDQFALGLNELGWSVGGNVLIEYRYAEGQRERLGPLANELVDLGVEVIAATDTPAIMAAKQATETVPIVMVASADPKRSGFIEDLARPGTNITGLTTISVQLAEKRLELLQDILPRLSGLGVFWDPSNPIREDEWVRTKEAADARAVRPLSFPVRTPEEFEPAIQSAIADGANAFIVISDPVFFLNRHALYALSEKYRIPVMYENENSVEDGGLISYGTVLSENFYRSAWYVDRLLKGEEAAELPVQEPRTYVLTLNLSAARAIDLDIPKSVRDRADRVIE